MLLTVKNALSPADRPGVIGFERVRVLVFGDLILDVYVEGAVTRISPEAPIPVVHKRSERYVTGGAANVAANVAALGGHAHLVGVTGDDVSASTLRELIAGLGGVDMSSAIRAAGRPTITKTRILSGGHQLLRIDEEDSAPLDEELKRALVAATEAAMERCDVVLVSDYAKGACAPDVLKRVIAAAKAKGLPCIVDPKQRDFSVYAGATVIKPNRAELAAATGMPVGDDAQCEAAARRIVELTGSSVVLTRSEEGMCYVGSDGSVHHFPTFAREVFDVSGAGDTVAAVLAMGHGSRLSVPYVMRCANHAAGIVVAKVGTATVTARELVAALHKEDRGGHERRGRLVGLDDAVRLREVWRQMELTVGFTNGCFDLLHPGHVAMLEACAAKCDRLIVALNTDDSVNRLKGPDRPIQDETSRAAVVGGLAAVELVVLFGEDTPLEAIEALKPDVLMKGADYKEGEVVGAESVKSHGGRVALIDLKQGHSTSNLVRRMRGEKP